MDYRAGVLLFTTVLTIGQFVFAMGGTQNNYHLMLAGRAIFGLGGECMSVAQSAIISVWFKGNELSFAMGLNLSVSRLGSVLNGIVLPRIVASQDGLIGRALFVGFGVCVFSLLMGFCLVLVDYLADRKDGKGDMAMKDEDKFRWSDILKFKMPYWLITFSCMFVYMSVFPYIQYSGKML
jgi:MFS family permease